MYAILIYIARIIGGRDGDTAPAAILTRHFETILLTLIDISEFFLALFLLNLEELFRNASTSKTKLLFNSFVKATLPL